MCFFYFMSRAEGSIVKARAHPLGRASMGFIAIVATRGGRGLVRSSFHLKTKSK